MAGEQVVVGAIGKPFGVGGEVHVHPDPDLEHEFCAGQVYETERGPLTSAGSRLHSGRRLVRFEEASDREGAEALRGLALTLPRSEVPLAEGAHWVSDLLGADVVDERGDLVGVLEEVRDSPAHDLLVIARADGGEVLVPAVEELVEIAEGQVVLRPIPGLLDADGADE